VTEHATTTLDPSLATARELAPLFSERALVTERLGTLPPDLVAEARRAGLFRLAAPRVLGGFELDPATVVEVLEETCRADGNAGWTVLIGNATAFLAWLEPATAMELLGPDPDVVGACVFAPTGRLTPGGPGFGLDGRWSFMSGCLHADWFIGGALVMDGDRPRMRGEQGPDWRLAVFPAADGSVIENWDVAGLRGTGSHDVTAAGLTIPVEHTRSPFFEPARHDGPLWRFPFFTLAGVFLVSFPLGVARRALDEFAALAPTKFRPPGPGSLADEGDVQIALARAEGGLQSARAFVFDALGAMWESAVAGAVPPDEQRVRFMLATQQAMRAAVAAVDTAFRYAGAGALHDHHPLQRCFRDLHAAAQHIYFSPMSAKRYAKSRFGIDQPTFWF
jgi:alkylation response protein AidB-like acyl-CoA dehydrogenase